MSTIELTTKVETIKTLQAMIDELTAEMLRAAEALEFERAADLRDQIKALKKEK